MGPLAMAWTSESDLCAQCPAQGQPLPPPPPRGLLGQGTPAWGGGLPGRLGRGHATLSESQAQSARETDGRYVCGVPASPSGLHLKRRCEPALQEVVRG